MNAHFSNGIDMIRVEYISCSRNGRFRCTTKSLFSGTGAKYSSSSSHAFKKKPIVPITVWWLQLHKMHTYLRTSLARNLLALLLSTDRTQLMQFMQQDRLDVQCCNSLWHRHRYTECSLIVCSKHPKKRRFQIVAESFPKAPLIYFK